MEKVNEGDKNFTLTIFDSISLICCNFVLMIVTYGFKIMWEIMFSVSADS